MGEVRGGGRGGLLGRHLGRLQPAEDSREHLVGLQQFCHYWTSSYGSDFYLDGDLASEKEVDDSTEVLLFQPKGT